MVEVDPSVHGRNVNGQGIPSNVVILEINVCAVRLDPVFDTVTLYLWYQLQPRSPGHQHSIDVALHPTQGIGRFLKGV